MRTFILSLLLWFLTCISPPAFTKTLFIGIDESASNPVVTDPAFAKAAGEYLRREISALQPGDFVRVRSFADRSSAHVGERSVQIDRWHKAEAVAHQVAQHVAALPSTPLKGQDKTEIVAFLEFKRFGCTDGVKLVLLTDGLETGVTSAKKLLAGKPLPKPEGLLKPCAVEMYGLGRSKDGSISTAQAKVLRKAWADYFNAAGAAFTAIDP
jgi:hypothetical protein